MPEIITRLVSVWAWRVPLVAITANTAARYRAARTKPW
jgi:hypothetical protein